MGIHDLSCEWHLRHFEWGRDGLFNLDFLFDFYDFEREKIMVGVDHDETIGGKAYVSCTHPVHLHRIMEKDGLFMGRFCAVEL